jgi:hypothetical protein
VTYVNKAQQKLFLVLIIEHFICLFIIEDFIFLKNGLLLLILVGSITSCISTLNLLLVSEELGFYQALIVICSLICNTNKLFPTPFIIWVLLLYFMLQFFCEFVCVCVCVCVCARTCTHVYLYIT